MSEYEKRMLILQLEGTKRNLNRELTPINSRIAELRRELAKAESERDSHTQRISDANSSIDLLDPNYRARRRVK